MKIINSLTQKTLVPSLFAFLTVFASSTVSAEANVSWQTKQPMPHKVQEIYPIAHKGELYVSGGLTPTKSNFITDKTYIYNPQTDQWREGPALPEPRHHPHLISFKQNLYSFGGFIANTKGQWHASTDILKLDEVKNQWQLIGQMPHPQSETVALVLNDVIHFVSGRIPHSTANAKWQDHIDSNTHQIYNPATNQWTTRKSAPTARNSAAGAVINEHLYIVGGRTVKGGNLATLERYNPSTKQWQQLAPMPQAQGGLAAAAIDNQLYVFGGEYFNHGGGVYKKVWQYHIEKDSWQQVTNMPTPRHGLGAVAIDDHIYIVGGATAPSGKGTSDRLAVFSLNKATK